MSDPFADLLSSFKKGDAAVKKDATVAPSGSVPQAGKAGDNGTNSSWLSPRESSPEIHDDFGKLFGSNVSPIAGAKQQQVAEDEFDAAFKAFEQDQKVQQPWEDEPELVVDEVKDMEVAKLMSLDLSIGQATSYYERGILYEELVRKRREEEAIKAQRTRVTSPVRREEPVGFFGVATGLLEKGRQLVDQFTTFPQEQDRLSDRLRQYSEYVEPQEWSAAASSAQPEVASEELPAQFTQSLLLEEDTLFSPEKSPTPPPPPESTLLDFDHEETVSHGIRDSGTKIAISHLELSGYNEFKDRATSFFKGGDYVRACEEYEKCLNSLPKDHTLRIVAYSNLVASLLKIGEYKRCISDTEIALNLFPEDPEMWSQSIPNAEPRRTFKEMWSKIVARRAEAFEHTEKYQEALKSYQSLIEKGCSNDKIMEGKRRCQKVLSPSQDKPVQSKGGSVRTNGPPASVPASAQTYASVQRVKEDNKKEEALENQKAALYDKVFNQIETWKGNKGDDIRHLLANLSQVLTWCDWKPVSPTELVLPKKVKIGYMKAVAKTHPDKLPASLELEAKMLAENVFSTLSTAWEKFKSENDIK
ncbi:hypothetical protein HG536_0E02880 [Torulaspora globosa]|uniref:SWA2-like ubiquitin-associated domain-containing protein n=1 Tax=Torulaspora globosa TaxID=48254 RepID=A0A7G3ZIP1_9SACH|nr:uncharacterized protein HG536_0E02880 [Torulaspora globosa]QLL33377.1 hypothetical protein HG536_0E02880 [Torulaspora globosa]